MRVGLVALGPLIMLGHNYRIDYLGYPLTGILMMSVISCLLGIVLSYLALKSGSFLPAALAHGTINSFGAAGTLFSRSGGNPFIGPMPMGIVGCVVFALIAVLLVKSLTRSRDAIVQELTRARGKASESSR